MKLAYFTDLHATDRCPVGRREGAEWFNTQLNKLKEIVEISNKEKCHYLLFGGDLFDTRTPAPFIVGEIVEVLKKNETIAIHGVFGNHDYQGVGFDNINSCWMGYMRHLLPITYPSDLVSKLKLDTSDLHFIFCHHYKELSVDIPNMAFDSEGKRNILMAHTMITNKDVPWEHLHYDDVPKEIEYVLVSDYHPQWSTDFVVNKNGTKFIAPGAVSRMSRGNDDIKRRPAMVILDTTKDTLETIFLKSAPKYEDAFDLESFDKEKEEKRYLDEIMNSISVQAFQAKDPVQMLETLAKAEGVPENVITRAVSYVEQSIGRGTK